MPVSFLDEGERLRLNRFPAQILPEDLRLHFTLSSQDLVEVRRHHTPVNQLGYALQLGALRFLGFCPNEVLTAPYEIVEYLAVQLEVDPAALEQYGKRIKTRNEHVLEIEAYLGYCHPQDKELKELTDWLVGRALEHNSPTLLLGLAAEKLKQARLVRPGITRLARLVASARDKAQAETYQLLAPQLSSERTILLDQLLQPDPIIGQTRFDWLRQEARAVSPRTMLANLNRLEWLIQKGINHWQITTLNPNRRKYLAQQARRSSTYALEHFQVARRYPLLLAFVVQSYQDIVDETLDLFVDYIGEANRRAGHDLLDFREEKARAMDDKVRHFQAIGSIVLSEEITGEKLREHIFEYLPRTTLESQVEECALLIRPKDNTYYDFLLNSFKIIRSFSVKLVETFTFHSNPASAPLLTALATLREFNQSGKKKLSNHSTLAFVPGKWMNYVLDDNGSINRQYYELAALWELRSALRAGNVWVEGSRRYGQIESYLIPKEEWQRLRPEVCEQTGSPASGGKRLDELGAELELSLTKLERVLATTPSSQAKVRIEDDRFVLTPLSATEDAASLKALKQQLHRRMPWVELVSLLIEVDRWTGFSQGFEYAGEYEPDPTQVSRAENLYACLIAQACNMNLSRMEKASGLSADLLGYYQKWYLREETLKKAITRLVNYQYHQPLSRHWGGGTLSSSDGQRFPVAVKNRKAKALPRYFGYGRGLTFYTWTSDQHSQFGSKVVVSTDRDALYILDALMDNETELPLLEHTSDSAGFTNVIFGLFSLLGLQFSPRIKDIGEQRLFRTERLSEHPTLKPLVKGTINQFLIVEQWDELLRLVGSIKLGWVTASLVIGKLQALPQKNAVAAALAEYGKLVKTIFILRYYESETYRHRIEAQLNKGEGLHSLREFILFANQGALRKSQSEAQSNQAYCLTLVTNAVIVWNTVYLTAIMEQLKREGQSVEEVDLPHISPTRFEHINIYGRYYFNVEEEMSRAGLRDLRPVKTG